MQRIQQTKIISSTHSILFSFSNGPKRLLRGTPNGKSKPQPFQYRRRSRCWGILALGENVARTLFLSSSLLPPTTARYCRSYSYFSFNSASFLRSRSRWFLARFLAAFFAVEFSRLISLVELRYGLRLVETHLVELHGDYLYPAL